MTAKKNKLAEAEILIFRAIAGNIRAEISKQIENLIDNLFDEDYGQPDPYEDTIYIERQHSLANIVKKQIEHQLGSTRQWEYDKRKFETEIKALKKENAKFAERLKTVEALKLLEKHGISIKS